MIPLTWPMPSKNLYDLFMFESQNSGRVHRILRNLKIPEISNFFEFNLSGLRWQILIHFRIGKAETLELWSRMMIYVGPMPV